MSKDKIKMRYSYEQCLSKDKLHDNELLYRKLGEEFEPAAWRCTICGRVTGVMRPA